MNDTVDASSKYQDSLPISSDAIMEQLDNWGIAYTRADHVPLRTVEESKKVQGQFLSSEQGGGHIKNLYLRDNKKRNVLLVAEQDRQIDLKTLQYQTGNWTVVLWICRKIDGKSRGSPWCCNTALNDQWC